MKFNIKQNKFNFKTKYAIIKEYPQLENIEITPSMEEQTFKSENYYGYDEVKVNGVSSEIDENIKPENIKEGTSILGVTGTYNNAKEEQELTILPNFSNGNIEITPNTGKVLNKVIVEKDIALASHNIKEGVEIFGIEGTNSGVDINEYFETTINETNYSYFGRDLMIKKTPNITVETTSLVNAFQSYPFTTLPTLIGTEKVTDWGYFANSSSIRELPELDTSSGTRFRYAFSNTYLSKIPLLDFSNANDVLNMLNAYTANLTDLGGFKNFGKGFSTTAKANYNAYTIDISYCNNVTYQSLLNILNNLYDIATAGVQQQTVKIGSTNKAKLEATEEGLQAIANAEAKGWNIV